ncbi:hypothetical protein QJ527_07310 [Enterococcus mundtii]|uniref:Uncharacterized protein n=1 Tax=Enterococcus mundtii TaxID=53346 RepID=A0A1L8V4M9_ENTMU|nr:hypothetical protein [Enterococcus mundtii]GEN16924.1 hypothetical protein LAC02_02050 [Ligilactobacillus acidipiscis]AUB52230.1 hypothetical protein EM4838_04195 [Enterococcus mundtii]EYT94435.1 hypothetical protein AK89_13615 [Enterococcus mundtii CRL35]MDK4211350.1 hypothetical protein [Enterococcus mundtii]OJG63558.1 hypothetical protein RV08_GL000197 [Enterococcus mundtii]
MKSIWQYGRTGGKYVGEVLDDSVISVPYTDVPPLKGIELADQFFIPTENRWQELENATLREKLENLECLYEELKKQDECKGEQIQQMGQLNATLMMNDIQLANQLAEVKEALQDV